MKKGPLFGIIYLVGIPISGYTTLYISNKIIKPVVPLLSSDEVKDLNRKLFKESLIWPIHVTGYIGRIITSPLTYVTDYMADQFTRYNNKKIEVLN